MIFQKNIIKAMGNVSYFLCEQKDPDQQMQLLSLISIIDDSCVDKEVLLAKFLISRLSDTPY